MNEPEHGIVYDSPIERARALIDHDRHALAEEHLRQALAENPADAYAHAFFALCLLKRKEYRQANKMAELAVSYGPEIAYTYFMLAFVLYERRKHAKALLALKRAVELDPHQATYWGLAAYLYFEQGNLRDAMRVAENGLRCNPHDVECATIRAHCLLMQGDRKQARAIADLTLTHTPDSSQAHGTQGWSLLESGRTKEAADHFREALRLDPTDEATRQGYETALKSRFWPYTRIRFFANRANHAHLTWRGILGVLLFFAAIPASIAIFVNAPIGEEATETISIIAAVMGLVSVYAIWATEPLTDFILSVHPEGRIALSRQQRAAVPWSIAVLLLGMACLAIAYLASSTTLTWLALTMLLLVRNVHALFRLPTISARIVLATVMLVIFLVSCLVVLSRDLTRLGFPLGRYRPSDGLVDLTWMGSWILLFILPPMMARVRANR